MNYNALDIDNNQEHQKKFRILFFEYAESFGKLI